MDLGVGPPRENPPHFLFSFSGWRMGRPEEPGSRWRAVGRPGNGKWAIDSLQAPFLFWSVQPHLPAPTVNAVLVALLCGVGGGGGPRAQSL